MLAEARWRVGAGAPPSNTAGWAPAGSSKVAGVSSSEDSDAAAVATDIDSKEEEAPAPAPAAAAVGAPPSFVCCI